MILPRLIPVLLLKNGELVKTIGFRKDQYVGDPINAVKIFNEKEVDELIILDISRSKKSVKPNYELIKRIVGQAFMPVCYGGGISTVEEASKILALGVEKVSLNSALENQADLITQIANKFGKQSVVASIDTKLDWLGKCRVYFNNGTKKSTIDPINWAKTLENKGAGEILLTSIDREGTYLGYNHDLIKSISASIKIPLIANGGANGLEDFKKATFEGGASACAAGSIFVFQRPLQAVLISYINPKKLLE